MNVNTLLNAVKTLAPGIEVQEMSSTYELRFIGPKIMANLTRERIESVPPQEQARMLQGTVNGMQTEAIYQFGLRDWADQQIKQAEERAKLSERARVKSILADLERVAASQDNFEAIGLFAEAARKIAEGR